MVKTLQVCTRGIDYYGVLGLTKSATAMEIKEAYRRLAMQYNPERQGDPSLYTLFTLVGEAYEVLTSPLLKAIYDQYGEAGLRKGVATPYGWNPPYVYHGDPLRTFKDFFGTVSPYADLLTCLEKPSLAVDAKGSGSVKTIRKKEKPFVKPLCLKLEEVYHGGLKIIKIQRKVFLDEMQTVTDTEEKLLNITITPGMPPGTQITFPECGDEGTTTIPGDIIFVVHDKPHPVYKRDGVDLTTLVKLPIEQALVGTALDIITLDERKIRVAITETVTPEYQKIVHGEGMPYPQEPFKKGNLIIRFELLFPKYIPVAGKQLIAKAFAAVASAAAEEEELPSDAPKRRNMATLGQGNEAPLLPPFAQLQLG